MKVTKDQLKKMINEEIEALQEGNKTRLRYLDFIIADLENSIKDLQNSDSEDSKKEMTKVVKNIHVILMALIAYLKVNDEKDNK